MSSRKIVVGIRVLTGSLFLYLFFAIGVPAQTAAPASSAEIIRKIFGPEPAPAALPAGMIGSDVSDPRTKLSAGLFNAGEASLGIKHLALVKKPDVFHVATSDDPNDPKVKGILDVLARPNAPIKVPEENRLDIARYIVKLNAEGAVGNSDLAFRGNYLFQGNYYGIGIYDITDPLGTKLVTSIVCPGGQGDPSVYKNLLFMSVESPSGRLDCGTQGFPPPPPPAPGEENKPRGPFAQKDRFRGVRIFDISDIRNPKQIAAVQTCRGSHTHTLVIDPNDKENIYVYVSGTSFVRPEAELAGCSGGTPDKNPDTALFRIEVIKVPLAAPQDAKVVSRPRVFMDPRTGVVNSLNNGGSHDGNGKPADTDQCHDITVYSAIGLAAGACSGNGIILDIKDPVNPKRLDAVNDTNYSYWHSASFSNDGKKVVFTDEWGGGGGARCRANDPNKWGADAVFNLQDNKLAFAGYYKLPAAQSDTENCVAHNGSLIPIPGRDIEVQAWYQGGISVMDFTDAAHPVEIAYFDRGPIDANLFVSGGSWSAYWYNGRIYSSEIARGLDIFELTPSEHITQNEIDAAKTIQVAELNVQNQQRFEWPKKLVVAKAYIDQLERSKGLSAAQITELRAAIGKAEGNGKVKDLKKLAPSVEKAAAESKNSSDVARLQGLASVLKNAER